MARGSSRFIATVALTATLSAASVASGAVQGRYILFGNALSEKMGLVEVEVFSGGQNVVLNRPDVFTAGLDYGYWMKERDPAPFAAKLVDGDNDTTKRVVDFGSKVSCGYLDMALRYCGFEMDLGEEIPVDRIGIYRSRHTQKQPADLGWRYLALLDQQRHIVAWDAFNVYGDGWQKRKGVWVSDPTPAAGAPAGRVIPPKTRCWLSEAEYIRDFLGQPEVDLVATPTAEQKARLTRFQQRNDVERIEQLGRAFFRLVDLGRPGLHEVKAFVQAGKYPEAFDAFKAPFLETIAVLRHWNAGEGTSIYNFYAWSGEPDTRATLRARDLRSHVYADRDGLCVKRFVPGLLPPAKMQFPFQTRPLLLSYAAERRIKDLRLWETLTDDWAMGFQDAADRDPTLRQHFVLTVNVINQTLKDLHQANQANPDFVHEVSGASLARLLMPMMEELPVSYWRVARKCVFNHTFNATAQAYLASQALADFHLGRRLEREVSQALQRLHTYSQYRDGPMVETCDEGHFVMNMISPGNLYGMLSRWQPAWFTPAIETHFLDHYREAVLAGVRHVSPSGAHSRWPGTRVGLGYLGYSLGTADPYWRNVTSMRMQWGDFFPVLAVPVLKQPEPRAVIDTVFGRGRTFTDRNQLNEQQAVAEVYGGEYLGAPETVSDWLPYAGVWYFRRGWDREDSFLQMLNPAISNSHYYGLYGPTQAWEFLWNTTYRFQDYATPLLTMFAASIDGQMLCPREDTQYPSGSKQDTFTQAVETPQSSRWYSGRFLDFGEAVYEGKYHTVNRERNEDTGTFTYIDSPVYVNGVRTVRQIIQVRPARLFLEIDRIRYATPAETHTNRVQTILLLTEPGAEAGQTFSDEQFRLDPAGRSVAMRNPGNPGVTVGWFGQPALDLRRVSVNATSHHFWRTPDPEVIDEHKDKLLFGPYSTLNGPRRTSGRGVFAGWQATGESVLIAAVAANRPGEEPVQSMADISTAAYAGVRVETSAGDHVTLLVARRAPADLSAGALTVTGEALLVVEEPGEMTSGIVLAASAVAVRGRAAAGLGCADFAFTLDAGRSTAALRMESSSRS